MVAYYYFVLSVVFFLASVPLIDAETEENSTETFINTLNGSQLILTDEITKILNDIQKNYDKRVRPNYGGEPVNIGVTMFVLSISSVSEAEMDFTFSFYFRQVWNDSRLKFQGPPGVKALFLGAEYLPTLWIPDTFFINEKMSYFHTATTSNELLKITEDGEVMRSTRLTITASCPMNLRYFPMDRQLCTIEIESYRYSLADVEYSWHRGPDSVGIAPDVSLPQFKVLGHRQKQITIYLFHANYSRLGLEIQFVRSMGYYLIQIYVPSSLIVIISWLSFWLNRNATTARVALGVTTVLTMATLMSSANATLPKISYVKSMDVFLATCFLMVFASLIENAVVGYMKKRIQMRKIVFSALQERLHEQKRLLDDHINDEDDEGQFEKQTKVKHSKLAEVSPVKRITSEATTNEMLELVLSGNSADMDKLFGITPFMIDKYSRILFPLGFIIFNLLYWTIYLHISNVIEDDLVLFQAPA